MYSQYNLQRQSLPSTSQPQVVPSTQYRAQNSGLPSPMMSPHRGQASFTERGTALVGRPIFFPSGPYMGRTIRMELHEIQKADLGRKYARVDRRPLDPPPVVQLKMFEVFHAGTDRQQEEEMEYDDVQVLGLLCTVDLFPVLRPGSLSVPDRDGKKSSSHKASGQAAFHSSPSPSSSSSAYNGEHGPHTHTQQIHGYRHSPPSSAPSTSNRAFKGRQGHFGEHIMSPNSPPDVVHHFEGYPVTEKSKQTQALVGATFVQPVLIQYQGSKAIVFVFSDLAVKIEGHFILRYRAFDIFARPYSDSDDLAISAECYGGAFRVYSTKEFPGLSASTDLTKLLSIWGVRLNIRVAERRRRKRPASEDDKESGRDSDHDDE